MGAPAAARIGHPPAIINVRPSSIRSLSQNGSTRLALALLSPPLARAACIGTGGSRLLTARTAPLEPGATETVMVVMRSKGECRGRFHPCGSACGVSILRRVRRRIRAVTRHGGNSNFGTGPGIEGRRLRRKLEFVQLRDTLGARRRSIHQVRSPANRPGRQSGSGGTGPAMGQPLPAQHRARSLRRRPLYLRDAGLRIRRRRYWPWIYALINGRRCPTAPSFADAVRQSIRSSFGPAGSGR